MATKAKRVQLPVNPEVETVKPVVLPPPVQPEIEPWKRDLGLDELVDLNLSYSVLLTIPREKFVELAQANITVGKEIQQEQKAYKKTAKPVGKMYAAMFVKFHEGLETGDVDHGTPYATWFTEVTGTKPQGLAQQCAVVFRKLVVPGHMTELAYNLAKVDWHSKLSTIVNLCIKQKKAMSCDEIMDAVRIMEKNDADEGGAQLQAIKNDLDGKQTIAANGKGPELDAKNFQVLLQRGFELGFRGIAITELYEQAKKIQGTVTLDPKTTVELKAFYFGVQTLVDAFSSITKETVARWSAEKSAATAPTKIISEVTTASFVAWAKENYEGMEENDLAFTAKSVESFYATEKRLPKDSSEFDAWMEDAAVAAA